MFGGSFVIAQKAQGGERLILLFLPGFDSSWCFLNKISALIDCLINPLQEQMEEWKKAVNQLDKDHAKGNYTGWAVCDLLLLNKYVCFKEFFPLAFFLCSVPEDLTNQLARVLIRASS